MITGRYIFRSRTRRTAGLPSESKDETITGPYPRTFLTYQFVITNPLGHINHLNASASPVPRICGIGEFKVMELGVVAARRRSHGKSDDIYFMLKCDPESIRRKTNNITCRLWFWLKTPPRRCPPGWRIRPFYNTEIQWTGQIENGTTRSKLFKDKYENYIEQILWGDRVPRGRPAHLPTAYYRYLIFGCFISFHFLWVPADVTDIYCKYWTKYVSSNCGNKQLSVR